MIRRTVVAVLLLAGTAAPAQADRAQELAGLFMQGCLPYAGNPAALRRWASGNKLAYVPEPARGVFLNGAPGQVFDASNASGKFVVVSSDDGLCSCVGDTVVGDALVRAVEDDLKQAGIGFRRVIDRDDRRAAELHYNEYIAGLHGRVWRILIATVRDPKGGHAMLTAGPEK